MSIPYTQHRLWVGPPMPDLYADWLTEWERLHDRWQHVMWTEDNLPVLENQHLWDDAPTIAPSAVEQFRSDVARYEIMYEHGGVWLDVDFEPHKPIDELMDGDPWVVRHAGKWVANGVIAFPPRHPAMREAIDRLPDSVIHTKPHYGNSRRSGPRFLTPIVQRHVRAGDVRVLPPETFLPYEWNELERHSEVQGTFATHHWNNQRRRRGMELTSLDPS